MEIGKFFEQNQNRINQLSDDDWRVALTKCKEHIRWKLKQKTLSGVHAAANLGADPIDHYLGVAYEKIISGEWEWKEKYTLEDQMIRIVNSYISKAVEKAEKVDEEAFKIVYKDINVEFYEEEEPPKNNRDAIMYDAKIQSIYTAAAGDVQLEFIVEAIKEGKKRVEIADLLEITPRQLDKLKEKLIRRATKATITSE